MNDNQYNAIRNVARYAFAMIDTQLFLDVYPDNCEAMEYYLEMKKNHEAAVAEYERTYGPLTVDSAAAINDGCWKWTQGPWPWQVTKGGCGVCGRM